MKLLDKVKLSLNSPGQDLLLINFIKNNLTKILVSKSSISIHTSPSQLWGALVKPEIAKEYFFGAKIITDWQEGSSILFKGEFNGNKYEEKGIILKVIPNHHLQYSHWSKFDGLPDDPDNYRTWTFDIEEINNISHLTITEDNIPSQKQKNRSDEFWRDVLQKIKRLTEKQ